MSVIPPKKPRKPGMPKLSIPVLPPASSSAPATTSQNEETPFNPTASRAQQSSQASQRPQPSLLIPQASSSTLSLGGGNAYQDDGYEEGHITYSSLASTIYPDTVPNLTNAPMHTAITDDLRRAIGGMSINDSEGDLLDANGRRIPVTSSNGYWMSGDSASGTSVAGNEGSSKVRNRARADSSASVTSNRASASGHDDDLVLAGNFEVLCQLGEGASGEVCKVRHRPTGLVMAKKTISTSPNPAIHRQILRELAFNRSCHSDYIVRYYGAFLEDQDTSIAICMEYAEAGSLDAIYKKVKSRNGRTGEKVLGKVAECVLKGLSYLHERKIIHRDIKPSNIVVTREGQIKLCDFGVSGELINSMAGTFTGTSYYMAPERIRGLPYTITSDVWSLGLTILEVASNRFPFPAEGEPPLGPIDLLSYVVHMKVPELQDDEKAGVKWSRALRDFIERCLEKEPTKRPGPNKMVLHPFIRKSETRQPQPDIAKFVADVYGWNYLPSSIAKTPTQATPIGRMPSIRSAPVAVAGLSTTTDGPKHPDVSPAMTPVATEAGGSRLRALPKISAATDAVPEEEVAETPQIVQPPPIGAPFSGRDRSQSLYRTQEERLAAKMREADVGLVGSPTTATDDEGGAGMK